jgi:hypothetical protein
MKVILTSLNEGMGAMLGLVQLWSRSLSDGDSLDDEVC